MKRDVKDLKKVSADCFYPDYIGGKTEYLGGKVLDFKSVQEANNDWNQSWKGSGTILKIEPKDKRVDPKPRYRHLRTVLTPDQFKSRK